MSDDRQHCVITGVIASDLLDRPTYIGEWANDRQMFELTVPYARIMATRLKGKPLDAEHMEDNGAIGTILHSWVEGKKWYIQALLDGSTLAGIDMIKAVTSAQGSPYGQRIGELSLSTKGDKLTPTAVGIVVKGARDGCTIDNVSLVNSNELEAIKRQEYKIDDIDIPEHPPSETPRIAASFAEMSNVHQALRTPGPPQAYYQPADKSNDQSLSQTVADLKQEIARMKGAAPAAPTASAPPQSRVYNSTEDEAQSLEKRLAELRARGGTSQRAESSQVKNTGGPQHTGNPQVDEMLDDLTPGAGGKPRTSNQHILYTNPQDAADARFMEIAGVFDSRIPTNQQKEQAARALSEAAQQSKADREELAQVKMQAQLLAKKLNEAEARSASHEAEKQKQAKQAAMVLKRLIQKNTPPPTEAETEELESGVSDISQGKTDEGMQKLLPAMIRASAFCDVRDSAQSMEDEDQSSGQYSRAVRQALGQPAEGLIQASGANRKRAYENSNHTSSSSSSAYGRNASQARGKNWERLSLIDDIPSDLARQMHEMTNNPEYDTENVRLPELPKHFRTR